MKVVEKKILQAKWGGGIDEKRENGAEGFIGKTIRAERETEKMENIVEVTEEKKEKNKKGGKKKE